MAII
ncbi:stage II sporulation family protein, partial [Chlamydia psittaci 84-8471/1]|jgi:hypothetical protein